MKRLINPSRLRTISGGSAAIALLSGCGPSIDEQIATVKSEWQQLTNEEPSAWTACKYGPAPTVEDRQAQGERALAQWDVAAADATEHMSQEQEMEARASIARDTGILPSQVDLDDIYQRRAEQAKAKLAHQTDREKLMAEVAADPGSDEKEELCQSARDISRRKIEKYREMMKLYRER